MSDEPEAVHPMLNLFAKKAQDLRTMTIVMPSAEMAADALGASTPRAEHLVLAALDLEDRTAALALEHVGIDDLQFRQAVRDHAPIAQTIADCGAASTTIAPQPTPSPPAHSLYRDAVARIKAGGSRVVGAWFLLVACEQARGTFAAVLDDLGVAPDALADAARRELALKVHAA